MIWNDFPGLQVMSDSPYTALHDSKWFRFRGFVSVIHGTPHDQQVRYSRRSATSLEEHPVSTTMLNDCTIWRECRRETSTCCKRRKFFRSRISDSNLYHRIPRSSPASDISRIVIHHPLHSVALKIQHTRRSCNHDEFEMCHLSHTWFLGPTRDSPQRNLNRFSRFCTAHTCD